MTPIEVIVATPGLLLVQVPPEAGKNAVDAPIQTELSPDNKIVGLPLIVTGAVGLDTHPDDWVKVNVAIPCVSPVTKPELLTLAING